jgi:hypothetical protein
LLALREFNATGTRHHKIRPAFSLASSMPLNPAWADQVWIYHRFDHAQYNTYLRKDGSGPAAPFGMAISGDLTGPWSIRAPHRRLLWGPVDLLNRGITAVVAWTCRGGQHNLN